MTDKTKQALERLHNKHGDKYTYEPFTYTNRDTEVKGHCSKHNHTFNIKFVNIIKYPPCPECREEVKLKKRTDNFLKSGVAKHGDKFDYSKTVYRHSLEPITVICKKHNKEFDVIPNTHLTSSTGGCPECNLLSQAMTREEFINRIEAKFGKKFGYEYLDFKTTTIPITLVCPIHGKFTIKPANIIRDDNNSGCPKCNLNRKSPEDFIKEAKAVHGDKYDYSMTEYNGSNKPVKIKCNTCGNIFTIANAYTHITKKSGCKVCNLAKVTKSTQQFVREAIDKHANKYDYSKTNYVNAYTKVTITCPVHGDFEMFPTQHTSKSDPGICPKCNTEDKFENNVIIANRVHNNKYTYPQQPYNGYRSKIRIICPEHGEFYQSFNSHNAGHGCQICSGSLAEKRISALFNKMKLKFMREYSLEQDRAYRYDFYLPYLNVLIEYDGIQHFKPNPLLHSPGNTLEDTQTRDREKDHLARIHNIPLIRIPYTVEKTLEQYLLSKLAKIYKYEYGGKWYKTTKDLVEGSGKDYSALQPFDRFKIDYSVYLD